ncbi:isoprenoid synthase domain-containing protein [Aspergillus venezuelensis]
MDQVTAKELSDMLVNFLQRSGYNDTMRLPAEELKALDDYVLSFLPYNDNIVQQFCHYVHCTYPFLPLGHRQLAALYNSLQMSVDDVPDEWHGSLHNLCTQLSVSAHITHPIWNSFFRVLPYLLNFYGPYAQATLFRTLLEFIQATCLEGTFFWGYPGSKYPAYLRRMRAQGIVSTVLCFPEQEFPNGRTFDQIDYPLIEAACIGRSVLEVLREMVEVSIACRDRVQDIIALQADDKLAGRIAEFLTGYVRYHLSYSRYRIPSLCEESGNKQLLGFCQMSVATIGGATAAKSEPQDQMPLPANRSSTTDGPDGEKPSIVQTGSFM